MVGRSLRMWWKQWWGLLLCVVVFGAVGVGLTALSHATKPLLDPARALCVQHLDRLRAGRYEEAWDEDTNAHYKARFRRDDSLTTWRERAKTHGAITQFNEAWVSGGFDVTRGAELELVYDVSFETPRDFTQVHFFVRADGEGRVAIDESSEKVGGASQRAAPW